MNTFCSFSVLVCLLLLAGFCDSKGIKVGGIKAPKIPLAPKISVPKGPRIPLIVPLIIPTPFGGFRRLDSNERVKCYVCEGGENSLCDVSPAGNARQVKCERGYYCSTLRKETKPSSGTSVYNATVETNVSGVNSSEVVKVEEKVVANDSITPTPDATTSNLNSSEIVKESIVSQPVTEASNVNSSATGLTDDVSARIKRETAVNFTISRGCKRLDFLDGLSQAQRLVDSNATEKVYAQLCSNDLCNTNDGRLWCYECNGTGYNHECMQNPSSVAKKTVCEWNEACFVERVSTSVNSTNNGSSNALITVSRGCRRSSMTLDEESKIKSRGNVLTLTCRLSSYCNAFDANKLVRGNSGTRNCNSYVLLMIALLSTFLIGFRR